DDHHGGPDGNAAYCDWLWRGCGLEAWLGLGSRRRLALFPDRYPLHHAGLLRVPRQAAGEIPQTTKGTQIRHSCCRHIHRCCIGGNKTLDHSLQAPRQTECRWLCDIPEGQMFEVSRAMLSGMRLWCWTVFVSFILSLSVSPLSARVIRVEV